MRRDKHSDGFPVVYILGVWVLTESFKMGFGDLLKIWATKQLNRLGYGEAVTSMVGNTAEFVPALALALAVVFVIYRYTRREFERMYAGPDPAQRRLGAKDIIGEIIGAGQNLIADETTEQQAVEWASKVKDFVETAFGSGESALVFSDAGYTFYSGGKNSQIKNFLRGRIQRLGELMGRFEQITIRPEFEPETWRSAWLTKTA